MQRVFINQFLAAVAVLVLGSCKSGPLRQPNPDYSGGGGMPHVRSQRGCPDGNCGNQVTREHGNSTSRTRQSDLGCPDGNCGNQNRTQRDSVTSVTPVTPVFNSRSTTPNTDERTITIRYCASCSREKQLATSIQLAIGNSFSSQGLPPVHVQLVPSAASEDRGDLKVFVGRNSPENLVFQHANGDKDISTIVSDIQRKLGRTQRGSTQEPKQEITIKNASNTETPANNVLDVKRATDSTPKPKGECKECESGGTHGSQQNVNIQNSSQQRPSSQSPARPEAQPTPEGLSKTSTPAKTTPPQTLPRVVVKYCLHCFEHNLDETPPNLIGGLSFDGISIIGTLKEKFTDTSVKWDPTGEGGALDIWVDGKLLYSRGHRVDVGFDERTTENDKRTRHPDFIAAQILQALR